MAKGWYPSQEETWRISMKNENPEGGTELSNTVTPGRQDSKRQNVLDQITVLVKFKNRSVHKTEEAEMG